jgi:hypothetical protein
MLKGYCIISTGGITSDYKIARDFGGLRDRW